MYSLSLEIQKQKIVRLFHSGVSGEELSKKLDELLMEIYEDGEEMGLCDALKYVAHETDRQRIFEAIEKKGDR